MIAPVHILVGAGVSKIARWWLALPVAFWSHQLVDFGNPYIQHHLPANIDLWLGIPGSAIIIGLAWLPWRGRWPPRAWVWSGLAATLPDVVDWGVLKPLGHRGWIHAFFWSKLWLDPYWAIVWLVAAIGLGIAMLAPYRQRLVAGVVVTVVAVLVAYRAVRRRFTGR